MVLIVTYDLHNPGRDYDAVADVPKAAGSWAHPQGSVWFIDTFLEPSDVRDRLKDAGDPTDEYFVARMRQHWAAFNTDSDATDWLKSPNRRW